MPTGSATREHLVAAVNESGEFALVCTDDAGDARLFLADLLPGILKKSVPYCIWHVQGTFEKLCLFLFDAVLENLGLDHELGVFLHLGEEARARRCAPVAHARRLLGACVAHEGARAGEGLRGASRGAGRISTRVHTYGGLLRTPAAVGGVGGQHLQ